MNLMNQLHVKELKICQQNLVNAREVVQEVSLQFPYVTSCPLLKLKTCSEEYQYKEQFGDLQAKAIVFWLGKKKTKITLK